MDGPQHKCLTKKVEFRVIWILGNHLVMPLAVPLILRTGAMGTAFLIILQSTTSSTLFSSFVQVGTLPTNFSISVDALLLIGNV